MAADDDHRLSRARLLDTDAGAFDATSGPDGAFFMGDPDTVATKLRRVSEQLGGVDRVSVQMTNPRLTHADLLHGIELLGREVAPKVADV